MRYTAAMPLAFEVSVPRCMCSPVCAPVLRFQRGGCEDFIPITRAELPMWQRKLVFRTEPLRASATIVLRTAPRTNR
jgi:hypothetical protein